MFGDMVVGYMPNSDPWGPPGIRVMIIFVFYVNPQTRNIETDYAVCGRQIQVR